MGRGACTTGVAAVGGGGVAVPAGATAAGDVCLQACPDSGRGLSVVAEEHAAAVPSAHCAGVGGALPRPRRTQPELLAQHYTEADLGTQAIPYWQRAGQQAIERAGYVEAVAYLTKGLEVLKTVPDTPARAQHELDMQIALGHAFAGTKGQASPERGHAFARARELCHQVGDTSRLFTVLVGLRLFYLNRGELQIACALDEECLTLAQRQQDPALLMVAYYVRGTGLYWLGNWFRPVPTWNRQWSSIPPNRTTL